MPMLLSIRYQTAPVNRDPLQLHEFSSCNVYDNHTGIMSTRGHFNILTFIYNLDVFYNFIIQTYLIFYNIYYPIGTLVTH
jgi:hypothetical protein